MWPNLTWWTNKDVLRVIRLLSEEHTKAMEVLEVLPLGVVLLSNTLEVLSANPVAVQKLGPRRLLELSTVAEFREAATAVLETGVPRPAIHLRSIDPNMTFMLSGVGRERDVLAVVLIEPEPEQTAGPAAPKPVESFAYDAPVPMFVHNAAGQVMFANRKMEQLTGLTQRELLSARINDLLRSAEWAPPSNENQERLNHRGLHLLQARGRTPLRVRVAASRASIGIGGQRDTIGVLEPVDEGPLIAPDPATMEAMERMAGEVAHRFNNMLTVVLNYSELIANRFGSIESLKDDIDHVSEAGNAAARLSSKLLTFSRGRPLETSPLETETALQEMRSLLERILGPRIKLTIKPGSPPSTIRSSKAEFESLIVSLVENSRDAIGSGTGEVIISTNRISPADRDKGDFFSSLHLASVPHVCISVTDTGSGIPSHIVPRIFQPFFTTKKGADGLGLSIACGIAHRLGGNIGLDSTVKTGATLHICFPYTEVYETS